MSAVIVLQHRAAAYLFSDGASWDSEGRVVAIESKMVTAPLARAAFVTRGGTGPWRDVIDRDLAAARSFDELLDLAQATVPRVHGLAARLWSNMAEHWRSIALTIVGYSSERGRVEGWAIDTAEDCAALLPSSVPFELAPLPEIWIAPGIPGSIVTTINGGKPIDSMDVFEAIDPRRAGIAIMEEQRAPVHDFHGLFTVHAAGGFVEMATISAAGVVREILREWPDEIGQPIRPSA